MRDISEIVSTKRPSLPRMVTSRDEHWHTLNSVEVIISFFITNTYTADAEETIDTLKTLVFLNYDVHFLAMCDKSRERILCKHIRWTYKQIHCLVHQRYSKRISASFRYTCILRSVQLRLQYLLEWIEVDLLVVLSKWVTWRQSNNININGWMI